MFTGANMGNKPISQDHLVRALTDYQFEEDHDADWHALMGRARMQIERSAEEEGYE